MASPFPIVNPFHWGFNGTVKQQSSSEGTVELVLKEDKESISFDQFVSQYVPGLKDGANFKLSPMLFTGILQTLYLASADFTKKFPVFYGREIVSFSDGGVCSADWVMPEWEPKYDFANDTFAFNEDTFKKDAEATHLATWPRLHPRTRFLSEDERKLVHENEKPLIIVCHGLAGGSHEPIIRSLTKNLSTISNGKFQVVVLNTRGCARSKITTPGLFTAFHSLDIEEFLQREKDRHPTRKVYGVGFSFGATMLSNYLGKVGGKTQLTAACTLCNPWDMVLSGQKMAQDFWTRNLFAQPITQFLTRMVKVNMKELEVPDGTTPDHKPTVDDPSYYTFTRANLEKAFKFKQLVEFDNVFTAPSLGFSSGLEYYKAASPLNRINNVKIPLLVINSTDDPVVSEHSIPKAYLDENPNVLLCETDLGGHLAYLESSGDSWVTKQIADFFNKFDQFVL
ncbi:hypothetical protein KAFR_0I00680 [Kazachstania africana CBS 2517]|uniref:alcohol O-acetyltransferase n=1 Tax=Kazachstania africana (strain ATCC 22294 / BCRC 22015 / CBS 2517 / CECT 1963 / NBRC 1671 / NRRL Y-8276) TaxID=1071382 RepID=H2AZP9_KAZAF|nr:hypothetical protein KAFR_0I00680 [Kazachstania africana CBS 2517]CCF59849.1 hypothetical protein KAFR_0I00680 [Kazachstania africana CBS 2517]